MAGREKTSGSSSRDRSAKTNGSVDISNFHTFTSSPLPSVKAPIGASGLWNYGGGNSDWNDDRKVAKAIVEPQDLNYVKEHIEKEQREIMRLNRGGAGGDREGGRSYEDNGFRRGRQNGYRGGGGGRGRGRGRGPAEGEQHQRSHRGRVFRNSQHQHASEYGESQSASTTYAAEPSVYGQIPSERASDMDVFAKYDFSKRNHNACNLVINKVKANILAGLKEHQVMTIEGFTGCGKTTQVPQFILDEAVENQSACRIAITQPRRIAAISVANRVAAERGWKTGGLVGYQVGLERNTSEDTRLSYMTTGILLQLLIARKALTEWTHIIIDEVHERDVDTDLLLLIIKKIMVDTHNTQTKVILMSATLDPEKFIGYFPRWESNGLQREAIKIKVDSPTIFPITEYFLDDSELAMIYEGVNAAGLEEAKVAQDCYEMAVQIIEGMDVYEEKAGADLRDQKRIRGAVLVFLPGLLEIETMYKLLMDIKGVREQVRWFVLPLHSTITNEEQQRVFQSTSPGWRKIILATNIAESSITVPDIKYVVDFCLTKSLSFDPSTNYTCLRMEWASKNQCIQRRGRCGRVAPGVVYKMVTREFYHGLPQDASPEMLRTSLETVVLEVKLLDMGPPKAILALAVDPPAEKNIQRAVCNLKEIGALTVMMDGGSYSPADGNLTYVGRVLAKLPIDIRLGRLILLGHVFDCLEEAVIIAAGLTVKSPFAYPYSKRLDAYQSKMAWASGSFSDCIALLHLYVAWQQKHLRNEFRNFSDEKSWAKAHFVQCTSLREMQVLIEELYKRLRTCGIEISGGIVGKVTEEQIMLLKLVIAGGFYPNFFTRRKPTAKEYHKEIARELIGEDPFASVAFQGFPMEQPGELYKKEIARHMTFETCIPNVRFNGSKVVVTFDSRGCNIGPISSAVYRAVKLKQLRQNIVFGTPSREEAYILLDERKREQSSRKILSCPNQIEMPGLAVRMISGFLTYAESPSEFYIILKEDEALLDKITASLKENRLSLTQLPKEDCRPGQLCVINFRGKFLRARIDAERRNFHEIFVYLLDNGQSMWLPRAHAFAFNKSCSREDINFTDALAIKCRLSGIRPALRTNYGWCPDAVNLFESYCSRNGNQVLLQIYSIVDSVIACDLWNIHDTNEQAINDLLVGKKYADKTNESKRSEENHNYRVRVQREPEGRLLEEFRSHEIEQNKKESGFEPFYDPPPQQQDELLNFVTLRGPTSPLEMHFASICYSAHLKQVVIDSTSLNSVPLDQDPYTPASRMMVAANVAVAHRSGNLLARETIVMPAIPGLCGLLTMLFCPKLELRVDEDYSFYTGCVTGLGADPEGASIYRDHDMEIIFDTQITAEDVRKVNRIRNFMNSILNEHATTAIMRSTRSLIRQEATSLLEGERKEMEEVWHDNLHKWNILDPDRLIAADEVRNDVVFPLHTEVNLGEPQEGCEPRNLFRNHFHV